MSVYRDAALAYAEIGWSVFPISPNHKRPLTPNGFLDASTTTEQINAWWDSVPDAWIGLALRTSGLIAIDVDVSDGKVGTATLAALEAKYGPLPRTLVQQSGSGGLHILMADPSPGANGWTRNAKLGGEIRGKADRLGCGPHVDIKCNGYILLEPSGKYHWLTDLNAPPLVPETWLGALRKPAEELGEAPGADGLEIWSEASDPAPLPLADRERLRADLRALGPRARGSSTTFSAVLRTFHDYGLSLDDGYPYVIEWNTNCGSPRSESELHRQIENIAASGRASGQRGNRRSDLTRLQAIVRAAYDERAFSSPAPDNIDAQPRTLELPPPSELPPEVVNADPQFAAELERAAQDVLDMLAVSAQAPENIRPMFESARSLLARTFPATPFLVNELLTTTGQHVVSGEPKTAKTWASTELSIAVASGTPAFGKFVVNRPGKVAYLYAEDDGPSVQRRLQALAHGRRNMVDGWQDRLQVQPRGRAVDLTRDMDLVVIIASCRMIGKIDLLVLDPLRDIHSGKEDSSDEMKPIMERMRAIGIILGCAVLFVHHAAKNSADSTKRRPGQNMRGSGAIHGSVDCGLHLWDLRGDGQTEFTSACTNENRSAKSAGTFELTLKITDNKYGVAERAAWTIGERALVATKADKAEASLGDILSVMLDHGAPMFERAIQAKVKGSIGVVTACISGAVRDGFVTQHKQGTLGLGWVLTPKGQEAVRAGSSALTNPAPTPQPHPATAKACNVPEETT